MSNYTEEKINLVINKLTKDQYRNADLSGLIQENELYMITDDRGQVSGDSRYALINLTPSLSSVTVGGITTTALTCQASDLAINSISLSSSAYPLYAYIPSIPDGDGGRDFLIRVEVLSSVAPTIGFFGSGTESCDFESEDSEWATLEPGVNLFNFTETKR